MTKMVALEPQAREWVDDLVVRACAREVPGDEHLAELELRISHVVHHILQEAEGEASRLEQVRRTWWGTAVRTLERVLEAVGEEGSAWSRLAQHPSDRRRRPSYTAAAARIAAHAYARADLLLRCGHAASVDMERLIDTLRDRLAPLRLLGVSGWCSTATSGDRTVLVALVGEPGTLQPAINRVLDASAQRVGPFKEAPLGVRAIAEHADLP